MKRNGISESQENVMEEEGGKKNDGACFNRSAKVGKDTNQPIDWNQ